MLKNNNNKKISAKVCAAGFMFSTLKNIDYWQETFNDEYDKMSEREKNEVNKQINKLQDRIEKLLNKIIK